MMDQKWRMLKFDFETEESGKRNVIVFLTDLFKHITAWSPGSCKTNGGVCIVSVCCGIMAEIWWGRIGRSKEPVRVVIEWLSTLSEKRFPSVDAYLPDSIV